MPPNSPYQRVKFNYRISNWYKKREDLQSCTILIPEGGYIIKQKWFGNRNKVLKFAIYTSGKQLENQKELEELNLELVESYFNPFGSWVKGKKKEGISLLKDLFKNR